MGRGRVREYMLTALRALALLLLGGFVWSAATSRAVGPNWADPLKSLVDVAARRGEWRAARDLHDRATPLAPHWSALAQARRRAATELAAVVDA